jgi:hypothetical protein
VGLALGKWIAQKMNWNKLSTFSMFALGLAAVYILKLIPVVNIFTGMAIFFIGLGALSIMFISKAK